MRFINETLLFFFVFFSLSLFWKITELIIYGFVTPRYVDDIIGVVVSFIITYLCAHEK